MLRGRGVHHEVVQVALKHQCPDCPETRLADSPPQVSLYQSDTPWKVIVLDNAEFRVVTHFMLICDEATHFVAVAQLFQRHFEEGRNATGEEALRAVEQTWIQNYGYPDRVRLDPEGCFRSRLLEDWAKRRGIEIFPSPERRYDVAAWRANGALPCSSECGGSPRHFASPAGFLAGTVVFWKELHH